VEYLFLIVKISYYTALATFLLFACGDDEATPVPVDGAADATHDVAGEVAQSEDAERDIGEQ
jgi:hypothetical protein